MIIVVQLVIRNELQENYSISFKRQMTRQNDRHVLINELKFGRIYRNACNQRTNNHTIEIMDISPITEIGQFNHSHTMQKLRTFQHQQGTIVAKIQ